MGCNLVVESCDGGWSCDGDVIGGHLVFIHMIGILVMEICDGK